MKALGNFWKSGGIGKAVTLFVSFFAICCICSGILVALPTPTSREAAIATPILISEGATQTAAPLSTVTSITATVFSTYTDSPSPTVTSGILETATVVPTATIFPTVVPIISNQPFQVHFIDVGQGDAILIQTTEGRNVLIDGGDTGTGVVRYLQSVGVQQIDMMVATHPHADHIGGLVDVLRAFPVLKVVTNGETHTTSVYESFLDAIDDARAEYVEVKRGMCWRWEI